MAKFKVNPAMCMGFGACGACEKVCPVMAISEEAGKSKIDPAKCIGCGSCAAICPIGAIAVDTPAPAAE